MKPSGTLGLLLGTVAVLSSACPVLAYNPVAGNWRLTLEFEDTQATETYEVMLREDGYWSARDWDMGGNWSCPVAFVLNITGQNGRDSFSATSVKISRDYDNAHGLFVYSKDGKWREGNLMMER